MYSLPSLEPESLIPAAPLMGIDIAPVSILYLYLWLFIRKLIYKMFNKVQHMENIAESCLGNKCWKKMDHSHLYEAHARDYLLKILIKNSHKDIPQHTHKQFFFQ